MSIEQPLDQRLVDQTKRQIQALVQEIEQLSRQDVSPAEFYREFLGRVVSALAAVGGAVWAINEDNQLALQYQVNFQLAHFGDDPEAQGRHARLLYQGLSSTEGMLVPPHSGTGGDDGGANLTDYLLVLAPLRTDLEVAGVVEILQRSDTEPTVQRGYLRFLLEMCQRAGDFLKSRQLRHFSDRQVLWSRLEDFARTVHASLEPIETAYTIANEGRRLIECDRVSVAIRKGNKCVIQAVSGQDVFDKRSNTIRLLGRLASAVVRSGEAIWYTGDTRDMAPQVEEAVQEYVDESHSKTVAVLPLRRPPPDEEDDRGEAHGAAPPVGALIVEQIEDSRPAPAMAQRVEVVCRHSSLAMANAVEHQSLFLMPVWRALGQARWIVGARTLPKTLTIMAAVLALLAALCFWPYDFNVQCKGTLEPVDHCDVFAGIDGVVDSVPVHAGQEVAEGSAPGPPPQHRRRTGLDPGRRAVGRGRREHPLPAADARRPPAQERGSHPPFRRAGRGAGETRQPRSPAGRLPRAHRAVESPQPDPGRRCHLGPQQPPRRPARPARTDAHARRRSQGPLAARTPRPRQRHRLPHLRAARVGQGDVR